MTKAEQRQYVVGGMRDGELCLAKTRRAAATYRGNLRPCDTTRHRHEMLRVLRVGLYNKHRPRALEFKRREHL